MGVETETQAVPVNSSAVFCVASHNTKSGKKSLVKNKMVLRKFHSDQKTSLPRGSSPDVFERASPSLRGDL